MVSDETDYDHLIGGEFVDSDRSERIDVVYPYDGSVWATVQDGTAEDVDRAVRTAREAASEWRETTAAERGQILRSIADAIEAHAEELGELETRQNGRRIGDMIGQIHGCAGIFRHFASLIETDRGDVIPIRNKDGNMLNYVTHEPYGVVGAITPWNVPMLLSVTKIAPAIAAGNTVVHKPSEYTPVTPLRFGEILREETNLPDGVYNVVTGAGETGAALTGNDDIDKFAFTGSSATGRKVGEAAGRNLSSVSLELGGKGPNIVFPSADLDDAMNGVTKGIFGGTGQLCLAGSRILLHEDIADEFVDRFVSRADEITIGDPFDPETEMSPLASLDQRKKVDRYIDIAEEEGATIEYGGERPEDVPGECFVQPTVLTDVDNDMRVAQEEIFGPIASAITFSDQENAIELANDTRYGLTAGVWTENLQQAHNVADRLEAGTIWINEWEILDAPSPFGGFKDSGIGREYGREGLDEYCKTKSVWVDLSGDVADPFSPE